MARWTADSIPSLAGCRALVTGANSGLGFVTCLELARHGADVTMAVRDQSRGEQAHERITSSLRDTPGAGRVRLAALDLADLGSVRALAAAEVAEHSRLDLLVNNAGVMAIPRRLTADGFEMQFGTNHLGHAALTLGVLPALARPGAAPARVVTVSSAVHHRGQIHRDDLMGERDYKPWGAYAQSKLANLLFMSELQRRLDSSGLDIASYGAHPGYADTNLQAVGPRMAGNRMAERAMAVANKVLAQSVEMGALPQLYAATMPGLPPGSYLGPDGPMEQRGYPKVVGRSAAAQDEATAAWLWDRTEDLVGIRFSDVVASLPSA